MKSIGGYVIIDGRYWHLPRNQVGADTFHQSHYINIRDGMNHDVHLVALQYFDILLVDDGREEVVAKGRTILSIALTCSGLVGIALDELWRS